MPQFVQPEEQLQQIAAKTDRAVGEFRERGLYSRYCGPYASLNCLKVKGVPANIESVLEQFDIDEVNRMGSSVNTVKRAIAANCRSEPIVARALSNRQIEDLLTNGTPLVALVAEEEENHWLNVVGSDETYFYALDYNQLRPFEKSDFSERCLSIIYFP
jgi:hypothetical protein